METIYINNGDNSFNAIVTDSAERSHSLQQHNYVKLVWKSAENIPISANAYIEYEGQMFYALDDYFPTHKDGIYEYDIEFHAIEDTFNRPLFFRHVDIFDQATGETTSWKEIEWSLNGNLKTIAEIVIDCLNRAYSNVEFRLPPNNDYSKTELLTYSFSGSSISNALATIAEQNETEWWIENTGYLTMDNKSIYNLHFDKCELGTTIELNDNYTEGANGVWQSGGLKSVSQSGNTNIIPQKLFVYGSERNIIKKTVEQQIEGGKMNVSYDKKLRLPKTFPNTITGANGAIYENKNLSLTITLNEDSSLSIGGINNHFEQVKIFDEVYPKMDMGVTDVSVQNPNGENPIYWLKADRLKSITTENPVYGSINPGKLGLLIEGCTLMCTFTSGLLNGREFECAWRESTAEIGLIPIDENDVQIPSGVYKPNEGDTFVLWNLAMPKSSIDIAQNELCVEAINYIEELATSITDTDCVSEPEAFRLAGYDKKIKVGQRITVTSNVFRNGKLVSRVIKFSHKITKPYDISFTLASSRQTGRLATLENMIADVTHEVHSVGQVQRAISRRQWHDTEEMMQMLDSIQKQLVVVGDENNAFVTSSEISFINNRLTISKGYIQHQVYTNNAWKGTWLIESGNYEEVETYPASFDMNVIDPEGTTPFYVFARCLKNDAIGYYSIGSALPLEDDEFYTFVLGILSSEFEGKRVFNQSSGLTSIAGGTITTEVIQDPARRLVIDYSNATITARNGAVIRGAIQFLKNDNTYGNLNDVIDELTPINNALKGSTDIIGGLILANMIGMKNSDDVIKAGISGLNENDDLRFWAGSNGLGTEQNAPFRVYEDGRVFGTQFYGFSPAIIASSENDIDKYIKTDSSNNYYLDVQQIGSRIMLNVQTLTKPFGFPDDKKYLGAEIEIFNPNCLAINICGKNIVSPFVANGSNLYTNVNINSIDKNIYRYVYNSNVAVRWSIKPCGNGAYCLTQPKMPQYMKWKYMMFKKKVGENTGYTDGATPTTNMPYYDYKEGSYYALWVLIEQRGENLITSMTSFE